MNVPVQPFGVFVVDDELSVLETVEGLLSGLGYPIERGRSGKEAIAICSDGFRGVILLDLHMGDGNGLELLDSLRKLTPRSPIIVMTSDDALSNVVLAMRAGVFDFISKDPKTFGVRLLTSTRNALEELEREEARRVEVPDGPRSNQQLIAKSPEMKAVLADVERLGNSRVSVLIQGASGSGKEVIAHAIHESGRRSGKPFIAVNCAGIPDNLLESELLGYERGAFTGAAARKLGKFEVADGGTIFLDEIGEMSLPLQAMLLRVVQDGGFERLGGNQMVNVNVRVLSATNRDLLEMVKTHQFREDLYYRLGVFTLELPSLAARTSDIAPLVDHFLRRACDEEGRALPVVSHEVMRLFLTHPWPGNVRQLQNVIKHAVVVARSAVITIGDLPESFKSGLAQFATATVSGGGSGSATQAIESAMLIRDDAARLEQHLDELTTKRTADPILQRRTSAAEDAANAEIMQFPLLAPTTSMAKLLDRVLEVAFPDEVSLPTMDDLESAGIRLAMKRTGGNRKQTAERLQISRATLYRRIDTVAPKGRRRSGVSPE